ncbi:MAG TPA: hypothetical protein VHB68_11890 [Steroidobacteraceae bacterium]|nr:hypothetical protein [Steroidobacteraceae bacterium]
MLMPRTVLGGTVAIAFSCLSMPAPASPGAPILVAPAWNDIARTSRAAVSIEVCVEPPLRRGHPLHDRLFGALRDLGADAAHYQPYNVFPRLAVAELRPPADGHTFWDFSLLDPITEDFMRATAGHPVVFNIGTLPAWIFTTKVPVTLPEDPDEPYWTYSEFNEAHLDESTLRRAADYQARLASWYINGGFTDEYGRWHASGHHYDIEYWEVLNDPDFEGSLSPADYTRLYDAIVLAVHKVAPRLKFMGPVVGDISHAEYFTYFFDPRNHLPGVPIDMISYHMFVLPDADESPEVMTYSFFQQADKYLLAAAYIDALRERFIPHSRTDVVDVASELPDPLAPQLEKPIPRSYWSLSGGLFAYLYGKLALLGVDVVGASELIDSPGIVAASTLADWQTGQPNARYWVTKLLREHFGPGDQLVRPASYNVLQPDPAPQVYFQGFITKGGVRRVLLVNKRDTTFTLRIPGAAGGQVEQVDQTTDGAAVKRPLRSETLELPGLAVAVVTLPAEPIAGRTAPQ